MEFTEEKQGDSTFLVWKLSETAVLDKQVRGVMENNRIKGLLPLMYVQNNQEREVKYNITSMVPLNHYLSGVVNRQQFVGILLGIMNTILEVEEYMIEQDNLLLDGGYIYVNPTVPQANLIVIPIEQSGEVGDLRQTLNQIMFQVQFDPREDGNYVKNILNFLKNDKEFSIRKFRDLLQKEMGNRASTASAAVQQASRSQQMTPQGRGMAPQRQQMMPQGNGASPQRQQMMPRGNGASPQRQQMMPQGNGASPQRQQMVPQVNGASPQRQPMRGMAVPPASNGDQPPKKKGLFGSKKEKQPKQPQQKKEKKPLFGKKTEKQAQEKKGSSAVSAGGYRSTFAVPGQNQWNASSGGTVQGNQPVQRSQSMQGNQPVQKNQSGQAGRQMQSVPENQNGMYGTSSGTFSPALTGTPGPAIQESTASYGPTTVLNESSPGTMLLVEDSVSGAYIVRRKTQERIDINKSSFRIGKEVGQVDYCVADNPAVSRNHADIYMLNGTYAIRDNGSLNHTYVDGRRLGSNESAALASGMHIRLADEDFEFFVS